MSFAAARLSSRMAASLVVGTVPTGLEHGAADECYEKLGREAAVQRGSISCVLEAVEELERVLIKNCTCFCTVPVAFPPLFVYSSLISCDRLTTTTLLSKHYPISAEMRFADVVESHTHTHTHTTLQSTVLDRLETLPFDGQLDWTASLLLWQYHSEHIDTRKSSYVILRACICLSTHSHIVICSLTHLYYSELQ